ncbi:glycosyltransferase family 4 protein [Adhaeribacter rhizoryzae]|uniref:Glycosyltransferase family 4 protein n=1 Tax=Adhaeribacter rhizoryzae TaxID=2607907 RepID=A0A5M6DMG7_9BACT|nr:glycosyltransferase family 4 protein [Adhaeribacter rhizoryzae]KAA5548721.1 glycosyltransferase family 4 protein [Adhaeribacter rhizoryzae]
MKVLHLSSEKTWRGGEQQIAYLLSELVTHNVQVFVACRRHSAFETYCRQQNIPHLSLPFANEFDLVTALQLKKYCKQNKIDLVHVHSAHSHALSVWADLLGNNLPIILSRRVDFPVKNNWLSHYKYNYPGIRKIICVSDKIKEVMAPDLKQPEKLVTIHSGIDLSRFEESYRNGKLHEELDLPLSKFLIGNVSAIAPHKDYFTFVDTAAQLINQDLEAKFLIIGDGPSRPEVEAYVAQKNMQKHILFLGFRQDIPEILPELDVFLITSETEGLGTTILDAFACRVPVVATAGGGIPEIVKNNQTGMLAAVRDTDMLATHVLNVLTIDSLRSRLVTNATEFLNGFTKEQTALKTLAVYREVLGNN